MILGRPSLAVLCCGVSWITVGGAPESSQQQHRSMVVNGQAAQQDRYPYFVALDHFGGGSLIAPDIVLTAGHCLNQAVRPRVGEYTYSFRDQVDDTVEQFRIVDWERHPDYDPVGGDDFVHDFVLLKLSGPSTRPTVKINRDNRVPASGQEVVVMGLGITSRNPESNERPTVLQQAALNYLPNRQCSRSADRDRPHSSYKGRIFPSHLCTTGGPHNKRDACDADSGSPIIIPGSKGHRDDLLVALVSWGELCGDAQFPGVNSRVSEVSNWIDKTVCKLSDFPPDEFCNPRKVGRRSLDNDCVSRAGRASLTILTALIACSVVAAAIIVYIKKTKRKQNYEVIATAIEVP